MKNLRSLSIAVVVVGVSVLIGSNLRASLLDARLHGHASRNTTDQSHAKTLITPKQLKTDDTIKAGVIYQDVQSGYEFTPFEDMSYFRQEYLQNKMVVLTSHLGKVTDSKSTDWPRIEIDGGRVTAGSSALPTEAEVLAYAKQQYIQDQYTEPFPNKINCHIEAIPCVKVGSRTFPGGYAREDIYTIIQGNEIRIDFNDTSSGAAQAYYDKFFSTFDRAAE